MSDELNITGNHLFYEWFTRVWPKPLTKAQLANWKFKRDMAHAGWVKSQETLCDSPWLEVEHFLPPDRLCVLLAWKRDPRGPIVTMRTGCFLSYPKGHWLMSGDIEPKTRPTHWRELPKI